jgi:chemotaxis response regulator CheB
LKCAALRAQINALARSGEREEDPESALFSSMPESALRQVPNAHIAPLSQISERLLHLLREEIRPKANSIKQSSIWTYEENAD